jgi:hypothetical protein
MPCTFNHKSHFLLLCLVPLLSSLWLLVNQKLLIAGELVSGPRNLNLYRSSSLLPPASDLVSAASEGATIVETRSTTTLVLKLELADLKWGDTPLQMVSACQPQTTVRVSYQMERTRKWKWKLPESLTIRHTRKGKQPELLITRKRLSPQSQLGPP